MRKRMRPLSGRLRQTWRIISSKHCEKSSSLTGQMPLSLAWRSISFWSSISLRRATSILLAAWWLTYWIHYLPTHSKSQQLLEKLNSNWQTKNVSKEKEWVSGLPSSIHSRGGRIAFKMSSCLGLFSTGGCYWLLLFIVLNGSLGSPLGPTSIGVSWSTRLSLGLPSCILFCFT